jgi:glycosyltransferase involved in cell wall biosynthesis
MAARRSLELPSGDLVALYVGRLDYPKNAAWLLDLAAAALPRIPDLHVLLVGDGPDEPCLRAQAASRGLADRVRILGHLDNPLAAYQAADALLLPSLREGFSLVCAEAMSVGTPVLRTNTSGAEELIIDGVTGRCVPIDHDAFINAAIDFLSDRAKLAAMGRAAAQHVRENYTFERQMAQTLELYRRLIAPTSRSASGAAK